MTDLEILKHGVGVWNRWRIKNPNIKINLNGADLSGADLYLADLIEANLRRVNLSTADANEVIQHVTSSRHRIKD